MCRSRCHYAPIILPVFVLTAQSLYAQEPTAAELVRAVRASENWIHSVDSIVMRFEGEWTKTPEANERRRAVMKEKHPDVELSPTQSDLRPHMAEKLEIMFDSGRIRKHIWWEGNRLETIVWNGTTAK